MQWPSSQVKQEPGAAIILGGDFNQLPVVEVAARTGLTPLVHTPTRGRNILDMLMTTQPNRFRIDEASSLALKIQVAISRVCSRELRNIDKKRGTAALWKAVNNLTKGPRQPETGSEITAEELNDHYARVSTDPHYAPPALRSTAYNKREDFTEAEIFYALDRLRPTSEGRSE